ncbi:hypothetical protein [Tsukamurella sp. 1534]|uniref:hypothetical protein n=1 Tax=Tsukamurella sp. 1534 TaxID=1151061 RepID=UPI000312780A|nr:hypothetical protein [Tsukamurella sp. 1534]
MRKRLRKRRSGTDTLYADVSEWQPALPDKYPYRWVAIRSNDGTYRDRRFAENWDTVRRMLDDGRLVGAIVYAVVRPNWQDSLDVHIEMQGEDRPDVVTMADAESWGGQIVGDHSDAFNGFVRGASEWRGGTGTRITRCLGYLNPNDAGIWQKLPDIPFVVPSYGAPPDFANAPELGRRYVIHQYTDGSGYGDGLPEGYGRVRCDMNAANGRDPWQLGDVLGTTTIPVD